MLEYFVDSIESVEILILMNIAAGLILPHKTLKNLHAKARVFTKWLRVSYLFACIVYVNKTQIVHISCKTVTFTTKKQNN